MPWTFEWAAYLGEQMSLEAFLQLASPTVRNATYPYIGHRGVRGRSGSR